MKNNKYIFYKILFCITVYTLYTWHFVSLMSPSSTIQTMAFCVIPVF